MLQRVIEFLKKSHGVRFQSSDGTLCNLICDEATGQWQIRTQNKQREWRILVATEINFDAIFEDIERLV